MFNIDSWFCSVYRRVTQLLFPQGGSQTKEVFVGGYDKAMIRYHLLTGEALRLGDSFGHDTRSVDPHAKRQEIASEHPFQPTPNTGVGRCAFFEIRDRGAPL